MRYSTRGFPETRKKARTKTWHGGIGLHIGVCHLSLFLPGVQSLKGKRQISRSLTSRIRNQFNVAVSEIADQDIWQRLTLGICCISNEPKHANQVLSSVVSFVEAERRDLELLDYGTEIINGV